MGALKQFQDAVNAAALRSEQMRQSGGDAVANQVGEKAVADLNKLRLQLFTDQVLPKLRQAKVNQATIDSALYQWEAQTVRMLGDAGFMPTMKEMEDSKGAGSVSMLGRRRQYADDLDLARLNQQGLAGQAAIKARALTRAAKAPGEMLSSGLSQLGQFSADMANDGLNFVRRQFDPDRTAEQDKQTDLGRAARRMAEESRQKAERGGAGSVQSDNTVLGDLWQNTHDISTSLLQSTPGMVLGMGVGGGTSLGLRALGAGRSAQVIGGSLAGAATEFPQNYGDAKTSTIATLNERDQFGKRLISNAQMAANIPYFRKVRDAQIANGIDPQQADEIAREATVERLSQKAAVSGAAVAQLISLIGPGAGGYVAKRLSARQAASNSRAVRLAERLMGLDDIPMTAQRASQAVNRTTFTGLGLGTEASRAVKREAAEEAGQEFAMNVARENARATASGENFNWGNTTQNLASSAIAGGVMGGAMHMSTHGTQQQMDRRQINAMASQTQALEASMAQNQAGIQAIQQRAAAAGGQLSPAQQDELQARMDDHQQMQQAYQAHVANMQQLGLNPYGGVLSAGAPAAQGQAGTAAPAAPSAAPVQQPAPAAPPAPPQQPPATAPAPQQPPAAQAPAPTPAPAPAQQPGQPAPAATAPAQQGPKPPRWNVMGLNNLGGETVLMVDDGGVITHRPVSDLDSMEQEGLTFSSPDVEQQVNALRQGGVGSPQAQQSTQPQPDPQQQQPSAQQPDPQQQPAPQQNQADQFPDFVNAELARNGFGPSAPAPVTPPPAPPKPGLAGIAERAAQRNTPSAIETPENIQAMADYNQQMLNQAQQPKPPRWNVLGVTDLNGTPVVMVDDGGLMVHRSVSDLDAMQKEGMTFSSPGVEQQVNALRQGIAPAAPAPAPAPDQSQTVASPAPAQVTAPATAAKQAPAKPKKPRQPKAQKPADAAPAQPEQIAEPSTPAEAVQPTKPEPAKAAQAQAPSTATPGTQQGDITRADGKPFANANAARLQIGKRGLKDSHEVVEVGPSAFVVRPRQQVKDDTNVQPAAPATAKAGAYEDALNQALRNQGHKNPEKIKESDLTDEQWDAAHAEAQRLMDEGGTVRPKEQPAPAKPASRSVGGWQTRNDQLGEAYKKAKIERDAVQSRIDQARQADSLRLPEGYKTMPYSEDGKLVALQDADGNDIAYPLTPLEAAERAWQESGRNDRYAESDRVRAENQKRLDDANDRVNKAVQDWNDNGDNPRAEQFRAEAKAEKEAQQAQRERAAKAASTREKNRAAKAGSESPAEQVKPEAQQATAKPEAAEPFEHVGLKISPYRHRAGGEIKDGWLVQTPENAEREARGERQIGGDRILDSREAAIRAAEQMASLYQENKAYRAGFEQKEQDAKAAEAARKEANRGKTVVERRADAVLDKPTNIPSNFNLGNGTRREAMQRAVDQGHLIEMAMVHDSAAKKRDEGVMASVRKSGYMLGLSNPNIPLVKAGLEAQARLKENKYEKPEYRVYDGPSSEGLFVEISKTEYDYAQHLKTRFEQSNSAAEQVKPEAQQATPTEQAQRQDDQAGAPEQAVSGDANVIHVEPEGDAKGTQSEVKQSAKTARRNLTSADYRAMREQIIADVKKAISAAPDEATDERIVFDVEGDGRFSVRNNKEALREFLKKVEVGFTVGTTNRAPSKNSWTSAKTSATQTEAISAIRRFLSEPDEYTTLNVYGIAIEQNLPVIFTKIRTNKGRSPSVSAVVISETRTIGDQSFHFGHVVNDSGAPAVNLTGRAVLVLDSGEIVKESKPTEKPQVMFAEVEKAAKDQNSPFKKNLAIVTERHGELPSQADLKAQFEQQIGFDTFDAPATPAPKVDAPAQTEAGKQAERRMANLRKQASGRNLTPGQRQRLEQKINQAQQEKETAESKPKPAASTGGVDAVRAKQGVAPDARATEQPLDPATQEDRATNNRRDPEQVSFFTPYSPGDIVSIGGQDWTVKQDTTGWYLTNNGNWRGAHPTIRNIMWMNDLIREVRQAASALPQKAAAPQHEAPKLTAEQRKVLDDSLRAEAAGKKAMAQPNPSGRYTEDSPILTPAEAKELLEWQDMGKSDGVKTHSLFFYESKANKDAKTGRMTYGTVESYQGGKWSIDDKTYSSLSAAKAAAVELAIARLKVDGFVKMTEVEKILGVDAVNRPANKAAKLRKESERLAKEAHKMLDRIEPGQPVLSTRDRNLRERSMEKMRKAAELNAQADALEGAKPLSPEAMRERLQEASSGELKAVFDMLGLAGSLLTHRELVNALLAEDAQEVSDALDRAVADRKNPSPAPAKESAAPAQKPVVEHDGQAAEVKQPSATGIDKPANGAADSGIRFSRLAEFEGAQNESPPRGATPIDQLFTPLSNQEVDRVVQSILRDMAAEHVGIVPTAITVASFSDLPPAIQQAAHDQGATDKDVSAVWDHGVVYFVADSLEGDRSSKQTTIEAIREAVFHEVYGHSGVHNLFGPDYKAKLVQLYQAIGGREGLKRLADQHKIDLEHYRKGLDEGVQKGYWPQEEADRALMDELLAHMAQHHKPSIRNAARELLGAIRAKLRQWGLMKLSRYGDADLAHILKQARRAAFDPALYGKGEVHFSRRSSASQTTPTGMTVAKVRALLAKKIGKAALEALEKSGRLEVIQTFDPMKSAGDLMRSVMAWHGSPFKFDRFSLEHLGRGEGSQAFGWGLYFADSRGVAEWYRETLTPLAYKGRPLTSDLVEETRKTGDEWAWRGLHEVDQYGDVDTAIANLNKFIGLNDIAEKVIHWLKANRNDFAKSSGQLYQVRLPAEDDYLLWDKPLSEQSNKVWNAIGNKATVAVINHYGKQNQSLFKYLGQQELTGMDLYRALTDKLGSDKAASEYLHRLGISGIKYLDGTSRDAGEGNHNYVVFDDSAVQILETYYSRLDDQPEGFYDPSTGKATLVADALTEETVIPTLLHELSGHRGFQELMKPSTYQAILAQVKRMVQQGNPIAVAAWERAQVESDAQTREAELLPYLITEAQLRQQGRSPAMQAVQRLIDQTIRAIKTWAAERGFGPAIRNLSADDIRVLAEKMLNREASRPDTQGPKRSKASQQFSQIDSPRSELAAVRRQHEGKPTWMKAPNGKPTKLTEQQWLQVRTPRFKKWFGDWEADPANASKAVDPDTGEPLVVYHGTAEDFDAFRNTPNGAFFFEDKELAELYGKPVPAYLSLKNPAIVDAQGQFWNEMDAVQSPVLDELRKHVPKLFTVDHIKQAAQKAGYDGAIILNTVDNGGAGNQYIAFRPEQIKSAIGNTGEFSADNPDIRYSRPTPSNHPLPPNYTMARYVARAFGRGTSQSIGTMLHNALQNQEFRKVFDLQQAKLNQVNADAFDSIDAAPGLLDRLENFEDVKRMSRQLVPEIGRRTTANGRDVPTLQMRDMADIKAAAEAIFDGTLMHKTVFTDTELRSIFGLTDKQIGFYRSARKAIEISLNHAARSSLLHIGRDSGIPFDLIYEELVKNSSLGEVETFVRDHLDAELARAKAIYPANSDELQQAMDVDDKARQQMADVLDKLQKLLNEGYAPLMRFGDWYLTVLDDNGDTVLHERFESERQRNRAHTALINSGTVPDNFSIVTGRDNPKEYQLYQKGVNAEAIALFAKEAGIPLNDHQQAYYKLATSNHSALRRLIHRKGIPGFSDNLPRVLASFVMSSARHSANTLFGSSTSGPLQEALAKMRNGDENWQLKAQEMVQYADDPKEEPLSMKIRQLLFLKNMGGSVAFGVVNLMQPLQQTMPFLAREHGAKAVPLILQGIGRAMSFKIPAEFQQEYDRARREGHLDPASAWSLQGLERGSGGIANSYWGVMNHALGAVAEVTETVNRRATLFAALEGAKSMTQQQLDRYGSAYNYAIQAIQETQGVMNKGNRPKWARGTAGSLLMVYKQFGIAYVEQLIRSIKNPMWRGQRDKWRRSMWMMLMMLWALAGSVGLPFAQNIADTVKGTLSVAGHPVQLDREFEKLVGNEAADFILNGAWNYANLGVDLQGRTSMGSLIPGTQLLDPSITDQSKQRAIAGFGGASGGMVSDILDAFKNTFEGKSVEAAINLAPRSIGSMIKAGQMYTTGKFTDSRGRLISDDVTMADVLIKALDGQPARLADIQRSRGMESQADALQASQRRKFKARIVEAVEKKDKEALREALADLDQWNKTRKEYPVKITRNEIKQALKKRQQDWTQRSPVRPETLKRMADSM